MKRLKKLIALGLGTILAVSLLVACTTTEPTPADDAAETAEVADTPADTADDADDTSEDVAEDGMAGVHIFMFKSTGNTFGDLMYEGFSEYMQAQGFRTAYRSPAETTVAAQVQLLDELITQQVASITISTNGDVGYDEVFRRAEEAGIPIISIDSEANPEFRVTHINQAETQDIGSYLVQAAVLITMGIDYPESGTMREAVEANLPNWDGDEINIGVLSASIDTPVQNSWIAAMEIELSDPIYAGFVNSELDIKYGNDDLTASTTQAQAFIAEDRVDVIVSPTTVGIAAAGQSLRSANSDIRLTGLGLPSEMQAFMPTSADEDPFDFVCPYMMLWDVIHLGAVSASAMVATLEGTFDGSVGSSFEMQAFRDYPVTLFEAYQSGDGTAVLAGTPYVFNSRNMAQWIDLL
ncbi:MAG: substrate-binding domain-containing protein [Lachnospiraceae bacterium]|nr:substrate-binding domain-containing protein [Lachnospiraceae bacterium]